MFTARTTRQKLVAVIKDARGIKTGATAIAWHPDGDTLMVGGKDGSLQMWELRVPSYQPVMMKMNATLKHEYRADKQRPDGVCRADRNPAYHCNPAPRTKILKHVDAQHLKDEREKELYKDYQEGIDDGWIE